MIRIIRAQTLTALRADSAELPATREELAHAKDEAQRANDAAIRAETSAEQLLRDLAQAHAERIKAERERNEARTLRAQDKAATDQQMTELRADFIRLRDAAADTDTGETFRGALAYNILRDLYADAFAQGLLPKGPYDVLAAVLGWSTDTQPTKTTA